MPGTPVIYKATSEDITSIQSIVRQTWPETYGPIIGEAQVSYMLNLLYTEASLLSQFEQGHVFYMLQNQDAVVGFIDVQKLDEKTSKLHKIYLMSNSQGSGFGRLLLEKALLAARENGSSSLLLNVNRFNRAFEFYKRMGFEIKEEVDIPIGQGYFMNDYVMQKSL